MMKQSVSDSLQWVKTQLDQSLLAARNELEAYVDSPEDASPLERCADELHQVAGTLAMLELTGPLLITRELEFLLQQLRGGNAPETVYEPMLAALMVLPHYLDRLLHGQTDLPLLLLPQLNGLRTAAGKRALSEIDLFIETLPGLPDNDYLPPEAVSGDPAAEARRQRGVFQSALLRWMKDPTAEQHLQRMLDAMARMQGVTADQDAYRLWGAAAAVIEALKDRGLEADNTLKQLLGRVDRQLKQVADTGRAHEPERLFLSLLYFAGRARSSGQRLRYLYDAFGLAELVPDPEELERARQAMAGPDAELIGSVSRAIREDLVSVKEALDVFLRVEAAPTDELAPLVETLARVANTLGMINMRGMEELVDEQAAALKAITDGEEEASDAGLLEIARNLLNVESRLESDVLRDIEPGESDSQEPHGVDLEIGRAVFRESIRNLARVKESLTEFLEQEGDVSLVREAIQLLHEIEASLAMLELDRPGKLLGALRQYLAYEILERGHTPGSATLEIIADAVISVEYYLEALREGRTSPESILDTTEGYVDLLQEEPTGDWTATAVEAGIGVPADAAPEQGHQEPPEQAGGEEPSSREERPAVAEGQENTHRVPPVTPPQDDVDEEIVDIFLEEAEEVLETFSEFVPRWRNNPGDNEALVTVRRGFHTLKGSGRMVGAEFMGEFAWSIENMLNRVIDQTVQRSDEIVALIGEAVAALPELLQQLRDGTPPQTDVLGIIARAYEIAQPGSAEAARAAEAAGKALHGTGSTGPAEAGAPVDIGEEPPEPPEGQERPVEEAAGVTDKEAEPAREPGATQIGAEAGEEAREPPREEPGVEQTEGTATEPREPGAETGEEAAAAPETGSGGPRMDSVLYEIFSKECGGHLQTVDACLQAAREGEEADTVGDDLIRALHTLHGSANMAEATGIAELARRLEHLAKAMHNKRMTLAGETESLFRTSTDAVRDILAALGDSSVPMPDHSELWARIEAYERELLERDVGHRQVSRDELDTPETMDPALTEIFLDEGVEILAKADEILHDWSTEPANQEEVDALLRELHTLKGSARMAGARNMSNLTHELEAAVSLLARGRISRSDDYIDLLVRTVDQLHTMLDRTRSGQPVEPAQALLDELQPARSAPAGPPAPEETGPDEAAAKQAASGEPEAPVEPQDERESGEAASGETSEAARDETGVAGEDGASAAARQGPARSREEPAETAVQGRDEPPAVESQENESAPVRAAAPAEEHGAPAARSAGSDLIRVPAEIMDTLLNNAGEVSIYRGRLEQQISSLGFNLTELDQTVERLRNQLRELEIETEAQILHHYGPEEEDRLRQEFDPLELDRYTRVQQLSRALVESVSDLTSVEELLENLRRESESLLLQQSRVATELQDTLMRTRMVSFTTQAARLRRMVRQVSAELGKRAHLEVVGEAELDRTVLDRVMPALEHMLRNAIAHGLEVPEERRRRGKPEAGTLSVALHREGAQVVIVVRDDGAGLDLGAIRRKAIEKGLTREGVELSDQDIIQFILEPGFTTADKVTQISGRGVGMDVVDAEIKQLSGSLAIDSGPGTGTRFTIRLPFTLAISQGLLVRLGEETYAVPLNAIEGVARLAPQEAHEYLTGHQTHYRYGGTTFTVRPLSELMGAGSRLPADDAQTVPMILVRAGEERVALTVDSLIGSREMVVKSVGPQLGGIRGISGATILGDGSVVLILDLVALVRSGAIMQRARETGAAYEKTDAEAERGVTVMVVDDSITVRRVTTRLLESRQMKVLTAKDGVDAVALLQENHPDIMLLDIEMPRMDGYELANHMQGHEEWRDIPIIMITSRVGQKHRSRALEIGVDEYLGKPYQEADLLETINTVLERHRRKDTAEAAK
ncbi:MAG TPA: Hpt domain-containing protein [Gammaproteobacteria bacterium]|nr:Hpt domain-containing protein [Gammaproteobacteria bacterium]